MSPARDPAAPYNEAYDENGQPRPHYAAVLDALGDPAQLAAEVKRRLSARGVSFGAAPDGVFALDPVPRILTEPEWSELQAGIVQRLRALEALVADVYGDGRVFEAGVLAREDLEASPHYEPAMRGATPPRWVSFAGLDVIRSPDGRFRVIEDQVRMPAGIAYSVAARDTLATCSAWILHSRTCFARLRRAGARAARRRTARGARAAGRDPVPGPIRRGLVGARAAPRASCARLWSRSPTSSTAMAASWRGSTAAPARSTWCTSAPTRIASG